MQGDCKLHCTQYLCQKKKKRREGILLSSKWRLKISSETHQVVKIHLKGMQNFPKSSYTVTKSASKFQQLYREKKKKNPWNKGSYGNNVNQILSNNTASIFFFSIHVYHINWGFLCARNWGRSNEHVRFYQPLWSSVCRVTSNGMKGFKTMMVWNGSTAETQISLVGIC